MVEKKNERARTEILRAARQHGYVGGPLRHGGQRVGDGDVTSAFLTSRPPSRHCRRRPVRPTQPAPRLRAPART